MWILQRLKGRGDLNDVVLESHSLAKTGAGGEIGLLQGGCCAGEEGQRKGQKSRCMQ